MKRNLKRIPALVLALVLCACLLAGCGGSAAGGVASSAVAYDSMTSESAPMEMEMGMEPGDSAGTGWNDSSSALAADPSRKIIYTADLELESTQFEQAREDVMAALAQAGGYVQSSESGGNAERSSRWVYMSLRVPSEKYASFLSDAESAANLTWKSEGTEDVTAEYVDVEARLASLEAQRKRLEELRDQASTLEELLTIEEHLTDVQYRIESYTGQMRVLNDQIDYSTVNLRLDEVQVLTPKSDRFGDRVGEAFTGGWREFGEDLQDLIVGLVGGLPWLLVLAVVLAVGTVLWRKRPRRAKTPPRYDYPLKHTDDKPEPPKA
ncbi:MAG: DUF4349 domain-containing protein [Oscillospiraceae bacterium]|nr:DUF4349 domain-containing protein [Oscillospiraceae bacterium]